MNNWNPITISPPQDILVEVKDKNGNTAKAIATYYPFKIEENKTGRKWGTKIIPCEPYWDGGWLVEGDINNPNNKIDSEIILWREIIK